jgi:hypothetical protein
MSWSPSSDADSQLLEVVLANKKKLLLHFVAGQQLVTGARLMQTASVPM